MTPPLRWQGRAEELSPKGKDWGLQPEPKGEVQNPYLAVLASKGSPEKHKPEGRVGGSLSGPEGERPSLLAGGQGTAGEL